MTNHNLPKVVTFDGEARSGKGTIAQATKDYLRDEKGHNVMLIDRGQTFRVLVVAAARAGVDIDDAAVIDRFLEDEANIAECTQFVKDVYYMDKETRDGLLYTNEVGANSAKIGARPGSQSFVANLTKKWLRDAREDGFDVVLIDGRALEAIAREMDDEGICQYRLGMYFICDPNIGARRTLGYATTAYDDLTPTQRSEVDDLMTQIAERNQLDRERPVEPIVRPSALICRLPDMSAASAIDANRPMLVIDTSADMTKQKMSLPVAEYVAKHLV